MALEVGSRLGHYDVTVLIRAILKVPLVAALLGGLLMVPVGAKDWPQWRGPDRLAIWTEDGIVERFPAEGLKVTWRVPVNGGFSGPVVADGRVFVTDFEFLPETRVADGTERLLALDETTGAILWTLEWEATYRNLMGSYATGPRASPTVDGDRVYIFGTAGKMLCLKTDTGEVVWEIDAVTEYDTTVPIFGISHSPLVDGDRVIYVVGGEPDAFVVAFDKMTGEEVWRAIDVVSETGYAQLVIIRAGGVRQLILYHPTAVTSVNPETGEVYWEQPYEVGAGMAISTPVHDGNSLLVSSFYDGSMMLRLNTDRPTASVEWMRGGTSELPDDTTSLHSLLTTPIVEGNYIYGVDSYGELRALNARTGERLWTSGRMTAQARWGTAFMVRHEDRYFINNDEGFLIIGRFTPQGYEELDRTRLIEPTSQSGFGPRKLWDRTVNWTHPAYANRHIITRNDYEIIRASLAADDYE